MRIRRLQLTQFRHFATADVTFGDGLIHITGGNGAGKSTVLEGILWALYGTGAARHSDASLRRISAPGDAMTSATLHFENAGASWTVTRSIDADNAVDAALYLDRDDGVVTECTGAAEVTAAIAGLLKADRAAFVHSCCTGRRELQQMVHMRPAERLRLLGDEPGVTALRHELEDTESRMRTLATAPELLAQYTAELEGARTELAEVEMAAQKLHDEWSQKRQDVETKLDGYRRRGDELKRQVERLTEAGGAGRCPTCEQPLGGGAEGVIQRVEDEYYTTTQDTKWLTQRQAQLTPKPPDLVEAETRRNRLRSLVNDRAERAARCEQAMQELWTLATERKRTTERLEALQNRQPDVSLNGMSMSRLAAAAGEYVARISDWRYTGISIGDDGGIQALTDAGPAQVIGAADEDLIAFALRLALMRTAQEKAGPRLLILSEPFSSMDRTRRANTIGVLREMLEDFPQILVASRFEVAGADQVHFVSG